MKKIIESILNMFNKLSLKIIASTLFTAVIGIVVLLISLVVSNNLGLFNIKYIDKIITFGLIILLVFIILLLLFYTFIMKSIDYITIYAKVLSDGKLNSQDIEIGGKNNFNILAEALNGLKSNFLFLLDQTKGNILVLSDSIEKVSMNIDTVFAENEQVSSEMQEISSKSQEQLNIVSDTISKTDEVKKSIDNINVNIKEVETIASDANSATTIGKENLDIYNENINLISKSIGDTHEFITELKASASKIGSVVLFIVGLSKQLKLLSLNASIQAEKAGEAGKSFAVVAQEITKLSESTKEGIDKINSIITNILDGSDNVDDSIKQSISYFENGKAVFSNILEVFNEISTKNIVLLNQISNIGLEAVNINSNIKNTVMLSQKVNDSSLIVSKSTEEVVSSIEQELGELQEINLSMSNLHVELEKIENFITKFEIDIKPIASNPKKALKIAIIIPPLGVVWDIIKFGALYGKKVLKGKNTSVDIIPVDWFSPDGYTTVLRKCIKEKYDGVVTPGFKEEELRGLIEDNIPIAIYNTDIKEKKNRIAYVGENSYQAGIVAGKVMVERMGESGRVLILKSDSHYENFELRVKGFMNAIDKTKYINVEDVLEVPLGDEKVYDQVKEYLKKNTNINGIVNVTGGSLGLARAIEELNMSNKIITIVFYDNKEKIVEHINKGSITCTIGQDPFRQGYDNLIYMYNYLVSGEKPEALETFTKAEIMDISKAKHFLG
ncbi:MAG: ABC-type sugar transport system, periplasmic component [Clostridiaceae bacterium]|nr:ABC-type sugar transport system, periplasmic component [Clostridiaceae bacterium]